MRKTENFTIFLKVLYYAFAVIVIVIAVILYESYKKKKAEEKKKFYASMLEIAKAKETDKSSPEMEKAEESDKLPYRRKYLLTKNELYFYKHLKSFADEYNYAILAKVRLADLIEVSAHANSKEFLKYFGKIKSKHIDFMLCNRENLYPLLIIELNDSSHNQTDRKERDDFVKTVLEKAGYKIAFLAGTQNMKEILINKMEINFLQNTDNKEKTVEAIKPEEYNSGKEKI